MDDERRTAELLQELLNLQLTERMVVADRLDESIEAELPAQELTEDEQDEADHQLLLERLAEADAHPERLINGEQAMREILAYARSKKQP